MKRITLGSRWKTKRGLVVKVIEVAPFGRVELMQEGKSPNVWNVLDALNRVQDEICNNMNKAELRELGRELNKMAKAFEANAPEETRVPAVDEVTMSLSDVARTIIDSYNLPVQD